MPAHQDDKLAVLYDALTVTDGTINDLETTYVQSLGLAVTSVVANEAWDEFWSEVAQGPIAAGTWNDRASAWLAGLLFTGNLTDQWAAYWDSLVPVADIPEVDLQELVDWLVSEGWDAFTEPDELFINVPPSTSYTATQEQLEDCDFSWLVPPNEPLEVDVKQGLDMQGFDCL